MISDVDGMVSSKRVITLFSFFCIFVGFFVHLFLGTAIAPYIFDGLLWLTAGGLGMSLAEKFTGREQKQIPENTYPTNDVTIPDTVVSADTTTTISFVDDAV